MSPRLGLSEATDSDESSRRHVRRAAIEHKRQMEVRSAPARKHYYSLSERLETGEIDRMYLIEAQRRHERGDRRSPRSSGSRL